MPNAWNAGAADRRRLRPERRLVSQGLPAAVELAALHVDRPLRVGQQPRHDLAQRAPDRRRTPARSCRSRSCCPPADLNRSAVNRLVLRVSDAHTRDRPAAGSADRARRESSAAGGTTAASCARSICAASRGSTSPACRCCRGSPARRCAAEIYYSVVLHNYARARSASRCGPATARVSRLRSGGRRSPPARARRSSGTCAIAVAAAVVAGLAASLRR